MKIKYLATVCMALFLSNGMFSTTAFALYRRFCRNHTGADRRTGNRGEKVSRWNLLRLNGNMTLVDDEGEHPSGGETVHYCCDENRKLLLSHYRP